MLNFVILHLLQVLIGVNVPIKVIFKLVIVKLVIGDLIMILKALRGLNSSYKRHYLSPSTLQS